MKSNGYKRIDAYELICKPFSMIGKEWFLLTAGTIGSFNTMTAAWGSFGELWHRPVAYVFVRPTRFTYGFMEGSEYFTLCFFEDKYKKILNYCGSVSGKDTDKIKETGLLPATTNNGNVFFLQSNLIIECKKVYVHDLDPQNFLGNNIEKEYPQKDYHRMYIGEIIDVFQK